MRTHSGSCIALLLTLVAAAPLAAQGGLEIGAKVGLTSSTLDVETGDPIEIDRLTGFGGGGYLRIPLGSLALQPELLWMRKGASVSSPDFGDTTLDLKFDYVEIPLLLVIPISTQGGVSPYFFGGPAIAFEAGCEISAEGGGIDVTVDCDEGEDIDVEVERKKTDLGIALGAGIRIPAGAGGVLLEGRFTYGLTNLDDSAEDDTIKNRSIAVLFGYSFPLSR
jgi:hypothetical protein